MSELIGVWHRDTMIKLPPKCFAFVENIVFNFEFPVDEMAIKWYDINEYSLCR